MNHLTTHKYRESSYLRAYKALYLRAYKALHLSRILYKSAHFLQNKPNFQGAQMNANIYNKMNYKKTNLALSEVEWANSNPIKPKSSKGQDERK